MADSVSDTVGYRHVTIADSTSTRASLATSLRGLLPDAVRSPRTVPAGTNVEADTEPPKPGHDGWMRRVRRRWNYKLISPVNNEMVA